MKQTDNKAKIFSTNCSCCSCSQISSCRNFVFQERFRSSEGWVTFCTVARRSPTPPTPPHPTPPYPSPATPPPVRGHQVRSGFTGLSAGTSCPKVSEFRPPGRGCTISLGGTPGKPFLGIPTNVPPPPGPPPPSCGCPHLPPVNSSAVHFKLLSNSN